jgi:hypothetical protein
MDSITFNDSDNKEDTPQFSNLAVYDGPLREKMPMQLIAFLKHLEGAVELASPATMTTS